MEDKHTTIDSIMHYFQECVVERKILPPQDWMRAAMSINVLKQLEYDKLAELDMECNQFKLEQLSTNGNVNKAAETALRANSLYKRYSMQKARVSQIEEFIRLAKKNATLITDQMKNGI